MITIFVSRMGNYKFDKRLLLFLTIYSIIIISLSSFHIIKQIVSQPTTSATKTRSYYNSKSSSSSHSSSKSSADQHHHKDRIIIKKLKLLEHEGTQLAREEKDKNKTIIINGRKFDQVNRIECVDNKFYDLLMKDLNLIDPNRQIDYYGAYYDFEYAKAVGALVDTPKVLTKANDNNNNYDVFIDSDDQQEKSSTSSNNVEHDILHEATRFWRKTIKQYNSTIDEITSFVDNNQNKDKNLLLFKNPSKALSNYHFLLSQIELLKIMLLNGEESLIVLNNRVKKLNQAVGEKELHNALCNCITSRGGKSAIMLMNEIFFDKDSFKILQNFTIAERNAKQAALDVAEYCSYWYGDTIRSQAVQKEKLIKRLVLTEAQNNKGNNDNNNTLLQQQNKTSEHESRQKVIASLVQMSSLWLPQLAKWINATLGLNNNTRIKRHLLRASEEPESSFSTPFDLPGNYDMNFYDSNSIDYELSLMRRKKRETPPTTTITARHSRGASSRRAKKTLNYNKRRKTPIEPDFEMRVSKKAADCASLAFTELLSIAYDYNALIYGDTLIPKDHAYIATLNEVYLESFPKYWIERRDLWSKNITGAVNNNNKNKKGQQFESTTASNERSLDEEIDDSFESQSSSFSSYDRGARLGFTIGKFIGEKASMQWPDPAELNTLTYDSIFLAGVAQGYSEQDSRSIEQLVVGETAKRVAFTEANRQAFGRSLHLAYLNGAFVVPLWGVLHAQRSVSKRVAQEGGRVGFEAAAKAAIDFSPKAAKFFQTHKHERSLSAPYKLVGNKFSSSFYPDTIANAKQANNNNNQDKWLGLSEQMNQVQLESELSLNITKEAVDCGQKAGTLMGALLGLIVTPEAFETYTRFRGSLEALENEFNQFKLGAMRGYELGETWAQLNYTATMKQNLKELKQKQQRSGALVSSKQQDGGGGGSSKSSSSSLFEHINDTINTNNIFQYMVPNYGSHLIANHSRNHMLKIRTLAMDDNLIKDMREQAGDLIAPNAHDNTNQADEKNGNIFRDSQFVGELLGELSFIDNSKKQQQKPIKFNIINLGPLLEFSDSVAGKSNNGSNKILEETPLTAALSKVGKIFMKFSVDRKKDAQNKDNNKSNDDLFDKYLNDYSDTGDGYLSGTFNQLTSHLADSSTIVQDRPGAALIQDDFGLEVAILDELFDRIEKSPSSVDSVDMVENVMKVTTIAPKQIEAYKDGDSSTLEIV